MRKKLIVLSVVLSPTDPVAIEMIVMLSGPSITSDGISISMPSGSLRVHTMLGAGTPSATHERVALSGDTTVMFSGAVVIIGGTVCVCVCVGGGGGGGGMQIIGPQFNFVHNNSEYAYHIYSPLS